MIVWSIEFLLKEDLNTENRERGVLCRLRLSVARGTNIGKDADVGADVVFWRSCIFCHSLQLLTLNSHLWKKRRTEGSWSVWRLVCWGGCGNREWQSNFRCVTCFCLPRRQPDTLHLHSTPAWILIHPQTPRVGSSKPSSGFGFFYYFFFSLSCYWVHNPPVSDKSGTRSLCLPTHTDAQICMLEYPHQKCFALSSL